MKKRIVREVGSTDEQLRLWVGGESVHRKTGQKPPNDTECCPDFSCCKPELRQPAEVREKFLASDEAARCQMLVVFLGALLEGCGKDVRIVGP